MFPHPTRPGTLRPARPRPPRPTCRRRCPTRGRAAGPYSSPAGARVVIIGGGPGGYEAALVATQLGAHVTLIERQGIGGSAVLTDVVPSKSLSATAEQATLTENITELGLRSACGHGVDLEVD